MHRITSFVLLALLAGAPIAPAVASTPTTIANSDLVRIGWTKAQVKQVLGKPNRTSRDGNTWYYERQVIRFTDGKVSGFPGAAG